MQQRRINKIDPQTIFDVLLQHAGAISGLFEFMNGNSLTELDIPEGEYFAPDVINSDVVSVLNPSSSTLPVIGSGSSIDFYNVTVLVNGNPFNTWQTGSTHNINIIDSDSNLINVVPVGDDLMIEKPVSITAMPLKTMQTVSYATGDDADANRGRDFLLLPIVSGIQQLNFFGSKWRFTGVEGGYYDRDTNEYKNIDGSVTSRGIAYKNGLRIDWLSRDSNNVMMWYVDDLIPASVDWSTALSYCNSFSTPGFTEGWSMPNINEMHMLMNFISGGNFLIEELFNVGASIGFWTSTNDASEAFVFRQDRWTFTQNKLTVNSNSRAIPLRITNISEL